jgi:hypothetical protein
MRSKHREKLTWLVKNKNFKRRTALIFRRHFAKHTFEWQLSTVVEHCTVINVKDRCQRDIRLQKTTLHTEAHNEDIQGLLRAIELQ